MKKLRKTTEWSERGSLALEHVLFIGAVVAMFAGVSVFYNNMSDYFSGIAVPKPPTIGTDTGATP